MTFNQAVTTGSGTDPQVATIVNKPAITPPCTLPDGPPVRLGTGHGSEDRRTSSMAKSKRRSQMIGPTHPGVIIARHKVTNVAFIKGITVRLTQYPFQSVCKSGRADVVDPSLDDQVTDPPHRVGTTSQMKGSARYHDNVINVTGIDCSHRILGIH